MATVVECSERNDGQDHGDQDQRKAVHRRSSSEAPGRDAAVGPRTSRNVVVATDARRQQGWVRSSFPQPWTNSGRWTVQGTVEPTLGFEPRTCCLRNSCSTTELHRREGEYRRCPPDNKRADPIGANLSHDGRRSACRLPTTEAWSPRCPHGEVTVAFRSLPE